MVNNSNEIAENLIIIGNGFDLSSGLQSTFSDFMKYRMPNGDDNFSELLSSFQESNSNINDIVQKFQTDEEKIIVFNFWEYLLFIKKNF
ncbi:AbiH family protein [Lentilactobacillus kosonis]|uniref:Bacteriophage abortive infection AbiH n=1 Tax=Lentilactobacillus kosonis TaxID=2810561 RepID=A0A401FPQ3_9LACO|nr:AbiH family protein [Lentilactobacillus kosonis]GAY74370.1 hypothetical protein NBRC111893_2516 [Lentilactobacillus kosonis]